MKMASFANILVLGFAACYFSTSLCTGLESNLDENKLRLIRGRRDENGIRLDSFDGMSINEKTSNDYSTLHEYSSLDMESPVSENSISNAEKSNSEVENSLPASYFEGKNQNCLSKNKKVLFRFIIKAMPCKINLYFIK